MDDRPTGEGIDGALVLDANAVAGLLREVFAAEMTVAGSECATCGNRAPLGALRAHHGGPGVVLRCVACGEVMVRLVERPDAILVDVRGTAWMRLAR